MKASGSVSCGPLASPGKDTLHNLLFYRQIRANRHEKSRRASGKRPKTARTMPETAAGYASDNKF